MNSPEAVDNAKQPEGNTLPQIPRMDLAFSTWHVTFAQNCNLRCGYCATGHGTFGMGRGVMTKPVWQRLCEIMFDHIGANNSLRVEFGGGETFLYFDEWMAAVDYLKQRAAERNIKIQLHVTTNGTAVTHKQLDMLAENDIPLSFSIDGPMDVHDKHRRMPDGKGSFQKAFKNWEYFRSLPQGPDCDVHSVLTDDFSLADLIGFWRDQGVIVFTSAIQLPYRFTSASNLSDWKKRQRNYLKDLREFAFAQARILDIPFFMSDYKGPKELVQMWTERFTGTTPGFCGAGLTILAVDKDGVFYPCEGYVGFRNRHVGNVFSGIDSGRLSIFRHQRDQAASICRTCDEYDYCPKNCFGSDPTRCVESNFEAGCSFAKELIRIAGESYSVLERATGS